MENDFYCVPLKIPNNPFAGVKSLLTLYIVYTTYILIIQTQKEHVFVHKCFGHRDKLG